MKLPIQPLAEPAPLVDHSLRITPLGGLGEVGRNMSVIEYRDQILIIDCGVLFPEELQPGVDLILPDFSYISARMDSVVGLVLTHGHEDHIGAVPYLLRLRPDIEIYGSELTLSFLEAKLDEHRLGKNHLHRVSANDTVEIGDFTCEFAAVTHSIPDALAVFVQTDDGNILVTGDFKMDQLPLDGRITDLRAFARFGERGVDLFMVDSTNAEVPGFIAPEREIGPVLSSVFAKAPGQIIVASFASHVHRVQQVLNAAAETGRQVAFVGRSMERNMRIASEKGYLNVPDGVLVSTSQLDALPDNCRIWMATGSQGEPMAALSRIADGNHRQVELHEDDCVVFASSLIPGNENSVYRLINRLMRAGATVVHQGNSRVHVSGHAAAGELLYAYNVVRPGNAMPIHGEIRHLIANGTHALNTGVPEERVILAEDGVSVDLVDGVARISGRVPCEYVYVDGSSIGEIDEDQLRDRMVLSEEGFVSVFATVDMETRILVAGPRITARGVAEDEKVFKEVLPDVTEALEQSLKAGDDTYTMQQVMRRVLGRWVSRKLRRRPMLLPVVVEI
ncbi:MAG: ribonuclease J [Varibaculum sp.]|nr:ribonuclease J [Varibaculum sp.]